MKFVLEIELGNDAMQNGDDVGNALATVAYKLEDFGDLSPESMPHSRSVIDVNGNRVGFFEVRPD